MAEATGACVAALAACAGRILGTEEEAIQVATDAVDGPAGAVWTTDAGQAERWFSG